MIAIITFFHANPDHSITASSRSAGVETGIAVVVITVVTRFKALLILSDIFTSNAVTAPSYRTRVRARIDIDSVPIIASLARLA